MADLPLIEAVGMTKEFSGVRVLNNVNVSVAPEKFSASSAKTARENPLS
jgi:ABC-type sugar transport system ATPase subunit